MKHYPCVKGKSLKKWKCKRIIDSQLTCQAVELSLLIITSCCNKYIASVMTTYDISTDDMIRSNGIMSISGNKYW